MLRMPMICIKARILLRSFRISSESSLILSGSSFGLAFLSAGISRNDDCHTSIRSLSFVFKSRLRCSVDISDGRSSSKIFSRWSHLRCELNSPCRHSFAYGLECLRFATRHFANTGKEDHAALDTM